MLKAEISQQGKKNIDEIYLSKLSPFKGRRKQVFTQNFYLLGVADAVTEF